MEGILSNNIITESKIGHQKWLNFILIPSVLLSLVWVQMYTNNSMVYVFGFVGSLTLYFFFRTPHVRFVTTVFMVIALQVFQNREMLSMVAAPIFTLGFIEIVINRKIISNRPLTNNKFFPIFAIFILWNVTIGLVNVAGGSVTLEQFYRELLLWSPLFLLPIYYSEIIECDINYESFFSRTLLLLWGAVFLISVFKLRENMVAAVYLFEVQVSRYDPVNGAMMLFAFLSLLFVTYSTKKKLQLIVGVFISVLSLLLSFARTSWVATLFLVPVLLLISNREERKQGVNVIGLLILVSSVMLVLGYLYVPAVKMGVLYLFSKFQSASKLKTDASIYNRYIEWKLVFEEFLKFPLTGQGLGATFKDYNWLTGTSYRTAFTHSSYLSVLFKSGIVGFVLLLSSCAGFFFQGVRYYRGTQLAATDRALIRAGLILMLFMLFIGYTGNMFFQRELMLYIALFWCYIIGIEHKIHKKLPISNNRTTLR